MTQKFSHKKSIFSKFLKKKIQIELVHTIAGNAQNQNILINVILLDPKYVTDQSRAFYHSLAMITGGLMYQSPRRAAHELIPIIESRFQPDQVTIVRNQRIQATRSGVYIDVPGMIIIFFKFRFSQNFHKIFDFTIEIDVFVRNLLGFKRSHNSRFQPIYIFSKLASKFSQKFQKNGDFRI